MGLAKYHEDDKEIYINRMVAIEGIQRIYTKTVISFECPYCDFITENKDNLFSHIKQTHNITHPVIIVNDKVVNSSEFYIDDLKNIQIYRYGFEDEIYINGELILDCKDNLDFVEDVKAFYEEHGYFSISVGSMDIKVLKLNVTKIRHKLITPILHDWERNIEQGKMISFNNSQELTYVEKEYLKGFYNYFIGCIAKSAVDKRTRYYEAYSILSSFNPISALGLCVLKIIAFRFNWVDKLNKLCERSRDEFSLICQFYRNESVFEINIPVNYNDSLFVEDNIRDCMDAIISYMSKDMDGVNDYLVKNALMDIDDKNLKDRCLLLLGRIAYDSCKSKEANRYFSDILCKEFKF